MTAAATVWAPPAHVDQAARAEYEAGADLKSVLSARLDSGWAWSALGAAALQDGDYVLAYAHSLLGQELALRALRQAAWSEGQPVSAAVLLGAMVLGLAAESLGAREQARSARAFVANQGCDIHDTELLASLVR
ncbi:MAG: DUF3151 family protein [Bifidobacteriaceae bacterium]|jgi:hypothetical protein|nr:DUF3151 family protein [Bifidobacteriaceae bacterium]